jgi:chitin disaccharide deacetylase
MSDERYLIVNADDFGQSPGINQGIIEAHEHGIVTSASLMTRWLAAGEAALYARQHPELSVGLHFDVGEWICHGGNWETNYTVVPWQDESAVERELLRQIEVFRYLIGRDPSHINSHQHMHMREPVRSVALRACEHLGIPLRNLSPQVHYVLKFYGQTDEGLPFPAGISVDRLLDLLYTLPSGWSVLVCHPGNVTDLKTVYLKERREELKVLCNRRVRDAIRDLGITLCSFDDWKHLTCLSDQVVSN